MPLSFTNFPQRILLRADPSGEADSPPLASVSAAAASPASPPSPGMFEATEGAARVAARELCGPVSYTHLTLPTILLV